MTDYTDTLPDIERAFQLLGIAMERPGFYDDERFVRAERQDPRFLNMYARFVQLRTYSADYLARSERHSVVGADALRGDRTGWTIGRLH